MKYYPRAARDARILFNLALANGELDAVKKDFSILEESVRDNAARWITFCNPAIPRGERMDFFYANFSKTAAVFLNVIVEKRETRIIPQLAQEYAALVKKYRKVEEVIIQTAQPLGQKQMVGLGERISKALSRKVFVVEMVTPEIIGGLIIRFKDMVIDRSFRSGLEGLRESIGE